MMYTNPIRITAKPKQIFMTRGGIHLATLGPICPPTRTPLTVKIYISYRRLPILKLKLVISQSTIASRQIAVAFAEMDP